MNRIVRLLGLGLVLLLIAISGLVLVRSWLDQHAEHLKNEAIAQKRTQLDLLAAQLPAPKNEPALAHAQNLGVLLGLKIRVPAPDSSPASSVVSAPERAAAMWEFQHRLPPSPGQPEGLLVVAGFPRAPETRFRTITHLSNAVLLLIVLMIFAALFLTLIASRSGKSTEPSPALSSPRENNHRHEISSLTHLARLSEKQNEAIETERTSRLRAEQDLTQKQAMLNQVLQEKIRLGRDLHDGVIQSLYATGLTLQAAQTQLSSNSAESSRHLQASLDLLNRTIRDIRHYIEGLSPANVRAQTFTHALQHELQTLCPTGTAQFELKIDADAAHTLDDRQTSELLQIAREFVSNSLRHGEATQIILRLEKNDALLALALQDNGKGFDPEKLSRRGHGLDNLQARASALSAKYKLHSQPGAGTRITLTFPATLSSP